MTLSTLFAVTLLGCTDPLADPDFEPPSTDPVVALALTPGAEWRVGQPLTADLEVTSLARGARLDRSVAGGRGRPNRDAWTVRPTDGVRDPSPYWQDMKAKVTNARGAVRGGDTGRIELFPHHHVQFMESGTYAVQLATTRVDDTRYVLPPFLVQVKPRDAAAEQALFETARADAEKDDVDLREAAFRNLMALGNQATLDLGMQRIVMPGADPWWATLLETHPDREGVRAAMEALVADPARPVTGGAMEVMTALAYDEVYDTALGVRPARGDSAGQQSYDDAIAERQVRVNAIRGDVAGRVVATLADKTRGFGPTLAEVSEIAFRQDNIPWRSTWLDLLRTRLDELPGATLQSLLQRRWSEIADPSAVEALARLASTTTPVGDYALRRLRTLDPERFRQVGLQRLKGGIVETGNGWKALRHLDDLPPEVVDGMLDGLQRDPDAVYLLRLIVPVATREQTATGIAAAYDALDQDVPSAAVLGAYAAAFHQHGLRPDVVKGLMARTSTDLPGLLPEMALNHQRPEELLHDAMRDLLTQDGNTALAAADVIANHAGTDFRPALNRALYGAPPGRQTALVIALFTARGWTINKADRERLEKLVKERRALSILDGITTVTDETVRLAGRLEDGDPVLTMNDRDYVGPEAIAAKLSQLYPGAPVKIEYTGEDIATAAVAIEQLALDAGLAIYVPDERVQATAVKPTTP